MGKANRVTSGSTHPFARYLFFCLHLHFYDQDIEKGIKYMNYAKKSPQLKIEGKRRKKKIKFHIKILMKAITG